MNFSGETKKFKQTIEFFEEKLKYKDCSKIKLIKLYFGHSFYGICHLPYINRNNYIIKCRLIRDDEYPSPLKFYVRKFDIKSQTNTIKKFSLECNNFKEEMIWLAGHEFYHYLRHTRQIKGKNTEAQAMNLASNASVNLEETYLQPYEYIVKLS